MNLEAVETQRPVSTNIVECAQKLFLCKAPINFSCIFTLIVAFQSTIFQTCFINNGSPEVFVNMKTTHVCVKWGCSISIIKSFFDATWKNAGHKLGFQYSNNLKITFEPEDYGLGKCLQDKLECYPNIQMLSHSNLYKSNCLEPKSEHFVSEHRKGVW